MEEKLKVIFYSQKNISKTNKYFLSKVATKGRIEDEHIHIAFKQERKVRKKESDPCSGDKQRKRCGYTLFNSTWASTHKFSHITCFCVMNGEIRLSDYKEECPALHFSSSHFPNHQSSKVLSNCLLPLHEFWTPYEYQILLVGFCLELF